MLLMAVGMIVYFVFAVIILIKAFKTSLLWGLGSLVLAFPVMLIFIFKNWDDTKKPFLYAVGGFVLMMVGVVLGGAASAAM